MNTNVLEDSISIEHTEHHVQVAFAKPRQVISSAVLNGGMMTADRIVNLKVDKHCPQPLPPETTLSDYCNAKNWTGTTVGMMTAASMDSLRITKQCEQEVGFTVLVTVGLSNPRRAGDAADQRVMTCQKETVGTINIIAITTAMLTPAAMVEAVKIVTEAKAVALQDLGIMSPVSKKIATGTGTDATAIVSGDGPIQIAYTGKHVLFGEILASLVIEAVKASAKWDIAQHGRDCLSLL